MRRSALALSVAAALLATAANAQTRPTRVVAFGDSYADNGNFFRLAGLVPFPAPYPQGRFSNGLNFVDTISTGLGVPQTNFAIGGATTGTTNVNPGAPGFTQQFQQFVGTSQSFTPSDLVVFSIGGNDARAYRLGGGTVAGAAAAAAISANQAGTGLTALVGRGARQIVWTAGDVGLLPEAQGQVSQAAGTAFSNAYNTAVQARLAAVAAQGVQVAYVDIGVVGRQIQANAAAYGFTNTTGVCPVPACLATPGLADQFVFYFDGVHLTQAGYAVIGRYALAQVAAPYTFRAQGDAVVRGGQAFGNQLTGRLDLARGRGAQEGGGRIAFFLTGDLQRDRRGGDAASDRYDFDARGVSGGAELSVAGGVVGASYGYSRPDLTGPNGRTRVRAHHLGVYGGWQWDGLFAQGWAARGWETLSITRNGVIGPVRARAKGRSWSAGGRVGWLADLGGGARLGPVAGIAWIDGRVNAYAEQDDGSLNLNVGRQDGEALVGSLGAELRRTFEGSGASPYIRLTAEKNLKRDGRTVAYAAQIAPGIVNTAVLPGVSRDVYGAVQGGVSVALFDGVALDVQGKTTFKRDEGNAASVFAGVRVAF